jgi:hypothetical protein
MSAETSLKNALNALYGDRVNAVSKKTLSVYARGDLEAAERLLAQWEAAGTVRRIRLLKNAGDDDACVELLGYIQ